MYCVLQHQGAIILPFNHIFYQGKSKYKSNKLCQRSDLILIYKAPFSQGECWESPPSSFTGRVRGKRQIDVDTGKVNKVLALLQFNCFPIKIYRYDDLHLIGLQICIHICMQTWSKIFTDLNFPVHTNQQICMTESRFPDACRMGFRLNHLRI